MKLKLASAILVVSILVLLGVSSVFAITAYLDVSPKRIPPDGTVTIYVENKYEPTTITVDRIEVVYGGVTYTKSLGVDLDPSDSVSVDFGTGVDGWTPAADTGQGGKYVVKVIGPFTVEDYFDVSTMFSVPEFVLPLLLVVATGFALFALGRKVKKSRN